MGNEHFRMKALGKAKFNFSFSEAPVYLIQ